MSMPTVVQLDIVGRPGGLVDLVGDDVQVIEFEIMHGVRLC